MAMRSSKVCSLALCINCAEKWRHQFIEGGEPFSQGEGGKERLGTPLPVVISDDSVVDRTL